MRVLRMTYWKRYDPDWIEQEYNTSGARDDLSVETSSETILADLLPGINNQTRRVRYYWEIQKITSSTKMGGDYECQSVGN